MDLPVIHATEPTDTVDLTNITDRFTTNNTKIIIAGKLVILVGTITAAQKLFANNSYAIATMPTNITLRRSIQGMATTTGNTHQANISRTDNVLRIYTSADVLEGNEIRFLAIGYM